MERRFLANCGNGDRRSRAGSFVGRAHQWFGDFTTMRWFDDLWMKEGFATYMAAKMQYAMGDSTAWMSKSN